jgi:hypothetical protein
MTKTDIEQEVKGALARGYCSEHNRNKVLDPDLIEDMAAEVMKLSFASSALSQESKVKLSACCQEPVTIITTEEGTNYFTCSKCIRPCDLYIEP